MKVEKGVKLLAEPIHSVKHLTEPIHVYVLCRNRIRLWAATNAYTLLFLTIFGWLAILTLAVFHHG